MKSETEQMTHWHQGKLYELSPFGTGFVEDATTGRVFGFHRSMLPEVADWKRLEGAAVRFQLDSNGVIGQLDLRDL